jgi:hypothetical protein
VRLASNSLKLKKSIEVVKATSKAHNLILAVSAKTFYSIAIGRIEDSKVGFKKLGSEYSVLPYRPIIEILDRISKENDYD